MKMTFYSDFKYKGSYYSSGDIIEVPEDESEYLVNQGGVIIDHTETASTGTSAEIEGSEEVTPEVEIPETEAAPAQAPKRGTRRASR